MRHKCVTAFEIEKYDDDGFFTGDFAVVPEESIWCEDDVNLIGGEVHLQCEGGTDDVGWIEITRATLEEYFETID